jgi:hypothetical protein
MITPAQRSLLYRTCKEAGLSFQQVVFRYFRVFRLPLDADVRPGDPWEMALHIKSYLFESLIDDIKSGRFLEEWSDVPDEPDQKDEEQAARAVLRGKLYAACKKAGVNFKKVIAAKTGCKAKHAWDEALLIPSEELKGLIEQVEAQAAGLNVDGEAK